MLKPFMRYPGNKTCPSERTDGWTAQKRDAFDDNVKELLFS